MSDLHRFDRFVELNRSFHELSQSARGNDDQSLDLLFATGSRITWEQLLTEPRVILLSEAGSGKTAEIRHVASKLRKDQKAGFFLRLEHISSDFEDAFEVGSHLEFEQWLASEEAGWVLLDSVDEARLKSPFEFELAVKKIARILRGALQRSHIAITGRTFAWRPRTDLALCSSFLPFTPQREVATADGELSEGEGSVTIREADSERPDTPFMIVSLDDLDALQVETFAKAMGITDTRAFSSEIERADAYSFTARPQDLLEVVDYWQRYGRIGSRLELMRSSIERRLSERDRTRAEGERLAPERARYGARLAAGATTLAQNQAIRVPDCAQGIDGLPIGSMLRDWDDAVCATLLSRPIFDEAIYGAVRFHHREVREFLASEWLAELLKKDVSRRTIESLFFRDQYDMEVIVPSARPLLPWVIIMDERIRSRALGMAPELVFEGGDPSQLPLETRDLLLREICERLDSDDAYRANVDFSAVQRFASADLSGCISELLHQFATNSDVLWLLLRMVWQGQLAALLPVAKQLALDKKLSKYPRIAAFRAVAEVGEPRDVLDIQEAFLSERRKLDRSLLSELVGIATPSVDSARWLLLAIEKVQPAERYAWDEFAKNIVDFMARSDVVVLRGLTSGIGKFLARPPIVERRFCEISKRYRWLAKIAAYGVQRLIEDRDDAALAPTSLDILRRYRMVEDRDDFSLRNLELHLAKLVPVWPELNERLFWFEVEKGRKKLRRKKGERLTDWWSVSYPAPLWRWGDADFEHILGCVRGRRHPDDRLVALSLAFNIYVQSGRTRKRRDALWATVVGEIELEAQLRLFMKPPPQSEQVRAWKRRERTWKRRDQLRTKREVLNLEKSKKYLIEHIEELRAPGLKRPGDISNAQYYLHRRMDEENGRSTWGGNNWKSLVKCFGEDIASAFRDGVVAYWRRNKPKMRSEGATPNQVAFSTIFGLSGIAIEAKEKSDWPNQLNESDAELATRYATFELNGFPTWLPELYERFGDAVSRILLREVRWELETRDENDNHSYVLHDLSWSGEFMWDRWGSILLQEASAKGSLNTRSLGLMLNVIQGSPLPDEQIRDLAQDKCQSVSSDGQLALWYSVWAGVDPERAIVSLEDYVLGIEESDSKLQFVMQFLTHLVGGRSGRASSARGAWREVRHLKSLYLLAHRYIREQEDIHRAGKGVYSPGLRDEAQEARDRLFGLLKDIRGKEAFLALTEIARVHPKRDARPWIARHAREKAEQDAEMGPWSIEQVVEFNEQFERTPKSHRELFDLAWLRLCDFKSDIEHGDSSIASVLINVTLETDMRKFIGNWLRERAVGRYVVPQEEELADATRPDLRIHGRGFDAPVPIELKLADNWTGPHLFERLANQLCGKYLQDARSNFGIFGLVYRGSKRRWLMPDGKTRVNFDQLVTHLQEYWSSIADSFVNVDGVRVIGVDLTKRSAAETLERAEAL